jgi:hypothetical protein
MDFTSGVRIQLLFQSPKDMCCRQGVRLSFNAQMRHHAENVTGQVGLATATVNDG